MRSFWQIFSSILFMSKCVSGGLLGGNTSDLNWGDTLMCDSSLVARHPSHKCERGFSARQEARDLPTKFLWCLHSQNWFLDFVQISGYRTSAWENPH